MPVWTDILYRYMAHQLVHVNRHTRRAAAASHDVQIGDSRPRDSSRDPQTRARAPTSSRELLQQLPKIGKFLRKKMPAQHEI